MVVFNHWGKSHFSHRSRLSQTISTLPETGAVSLREMKRARDFFGVLREGLISHGSNLRTRSPSNSDRQGKLRTQVLLGENVTRGMGR